MYRTNKNYWMNCHECKGLLTRVCQQPRGMLFKPDKDIAQSSTTKPLYPRPYPEIDQERTRNMPCKECLHIMLICRPVGRNSQGVMVYDTSITMVFLDDWDHEDLMPLYDAQDKNACICRD